MESDLPPIALVRFYRMSAMLASGILFTTLIAGAVITMISREYPAHPGTFAVMISGIGVLALWLKHRQRYWLSRVIEEQLRGSSTNDE